MKTLNLVVTENCELCEKGLASISLLEVFQYKHCQPRGWLSRVLT